MQIKSEADAKKETKAREDALELINGVSKVVVGKGKKVTHFDLKKESYSEEEILKAVLGPTGNLRAPTLLKGKTLIVGYNDEMYQEQLT